MLKKLLAGAALVLTAHTASANFVVSQSVVTGADMAGLDVTVVFADGFMDDSTWQVINDTMGTDPNPVIAQESLSGGASTGNYSITQQGNSLGNIDDAGNLYGLWSITNNDFFGFDIERIILDGTNALIAFDSIIDGEGTPGSDGGRPFQSFGLGTATYSNIVDAAFDDLYFTLTIDFEPGDITFGDTFVFMADTDKLAEVSAPATVLLSLIAVVAFARARKS